MYDVNELVICKDDYGSREAFEEAIKKAVMVLLDNNYIMTVKYDEPGLGIVVINFNLEDKSYGSDYPYWLSPLEIESVITDEEREAMSEDEC